MVVLSQETIEKNKRRANIVMSADKENTLIEWIRETPCLFQKDLRDYRHTQKRTGLWAEKVAEMDMTGKFLFLVFNFFSIFYVCMYLPLNAAEPQQK